MFHGIDLTLPQLGQAFIVEEFFLFLRFFNDQFSAYDFVVQAEQGWMAITGEPAGTPSKIGVALADVVAGKEKGRTSDAEITLFKSNGIASWDLAVAMRVYAMAQEKKLGRELPLWKADSR